MIFQGDNGVLLKRQPNGARIIAHYSRIGHIFRLVLTILATDSFTPLSIICVDPFLPSTLLLSAMKRSKKGKADEERIEE
jgi:hypothetical protein